MTLEDIIIILVMLSSVLICIPLLIISFITIRSFRILDEPPKSKDEWHLRAGRIDRL